ncbi:hypothetical protein NDU88_003926 [Pleurodeles waltl]|uniref:Uncharacterized protein n=1 Tax=Pleurodeles waltl TaxID=8319 RepID=A0AAV7REB0_PLEWA|nr:hypothetical protein NDU88_003926 [Pleurodeles waltl]
MLFLERGQIPVCSASWPDDGCRGRDTPLVGHYALVSASAAAASWSAAVCWRVAGGPGKAADFWSAAGPGAAADSWSAACPSAAAVSLVPSVDSSSLGLRHEELYEAPRHPEVDVDRFLTGLHPGQEQQPH